MQDPVVRVARVVRTGMWHYGPPIPVMLTCIDSIDWERMDQDNP